MLIRLTLALAFAAALSVRAEDSFSRGLTPADFQAAGLGKLTPEELARLDALVEGKQTGAVTQAKEETAKVVTETVRKQVQAEDKKAAQAEKKKAASAGIMARLKVVLKPGTDIEYTTLEAMLAPPFTGWHKGTILSLTNGQIWMVTDDGQYQASRTDEPIPIRITPGSLGSFFMEIPHGGDPRVKFVRNTAPEPASP
jgi:hypothetical protein